MSKGGKVFKDQVNFEERKIQTCSSVQPATHYSLFIINFS